MAWKAPHGESKALKKKEGSIGSEQAGLQS